MTRTLLTQGLNKLWETHGAGSLEKNAAATYFYELKKPSLDEEAFGPLFCKLASTMSRDPWNLAVEIRDKYSFLEKQARYNGQAGEAARFCVEWAESLVKHAIPVEAIASRALRGAKAAPKVTGSVATASNPATQSALKQSLQSSQAAKSVKGKVLPRNIPTPEGMAAQKQTAQVQRAAQGRAQAQAQAQAAGTNVQGLRQQRHIAQAANAKPMPTAPAAAPVAPAGAPPAGQQAAKAPAAPAAAGNWTNRAIGAAAVGIPAAGYMALSGGQQPQQPVQGYGY
jgi:hypothetical protein